MRFHLTPMITEPEPSSRPALTLIITFIAGAALFSGIAQLVAQVL